MPFASSHAAGIYYERHGPKPGAAPAIVFVHGAGGNHLSWWQQLPHFLGRYTCVAYDQRGYGQSRDVEGGPGGAAFVDDLRAVMDDAGIERATLVAQSLGGWACLGFTRRWPERVERLVMCDTHGGLESPELRCGVVVDAGARRGAAGRACTPPAASGCTASSRSCTSCTSRSTSSTHAHGARCSKTSATPARRRSPKRHTSRRRCCSSKGMEDIVILPSMIELAAGAFPRARVHMVPEAGHSVYFERAATFNAILDAFLAE